MSHPFENRYGKKLSESYNEYHMPDQFIVSTDNKDQMDLASDMFNNSLNCQMRKNIIIQQGQQMALDPMKLKQMKDQQQLMNMMTQGLIQQQFNMNNMNLGNLMSQEEGLVRSKSSNKLHNDILEGLIQQKQVKQEERGIIKNQSSTSLKEDNVLGLQNIKGNVKNAYIKKINSLINMQGEDEKESRPRPNNRQAQQDSSSNMSNNLDQRNGNFENDEVKMLKNRESARNSRQRKKLYIGLLERKVEDLTSQIEGLRQQTEISFKHIHGIIEQNPCLKGMIIEQSSIIDQLNEKVNTENLADLENDEMVQLLVDSYKLRFSAAGSRRKQYIKYCFQNIAKAMLEGNYGPLLFGQSALNKNYQLMEDEEFNCYVQQLKEVTGLLDENQTYKTLGVVRKLMEHKKNQKFLMKTLRRQLKELRAKQQNLEDIMDDISTSLTPVQFAQFLTQINKQTDKICLKEEYQGSEANKIKSEQQLNPFTHQLISQLQLELLIKNQQFNQQNNNLMAISPMLIDPLTINDMIQKKQFPGVNKQ